MSVKAKVVGVTVIGATPVTVGAYVVSTSAGVVGVMVTALPLVTVGANVVSVSASVIGVAVTGVNIVGANVVRFSDSADGVTVCGVDTDGANVLSVNAMTSGVTVTLAPALNTAGVISGRRGIALPSLAMFYLIARYPPNSSTDFANCSLWESD